MLVSLTNFTFQYVSINTHIHFFSAISSFTLHSNMFLLIQRKATPDAVSDHPLHSNMFLLIRDRCQEAEKCMEILYIPICFY